MLLLADSVRFIIPLTIVTLLSYFAVKTIVDDKVSFTALSCLECKYKISVFIGRLADLFDVFLYKGYSRRINVLHFDRERFESLIFIFLN